MANKAAIYCEIPTGWHIYYNLSADEFGLVKFISEDEIETYSPRVAAYIIQAFRVDVNWDNFEYVGEL